MTQEERRQRAREAFHDASPAMGGDIIDQVHGAAESAIETAIRVKLTPEIIEAAGAMRFAPGAATATAVLQAAGFEVEQ